MRLLPIALVLSVFAIGAPADDVAPEHTGGGTVLIFGDSLSAAYGMATEEGWVSLLAGRLAETDNAYRVVNASVSGETTAGGLGRIAAVLDRHRPRIVVIELGGNDGLRGYPVPSIRDNLAAMTRAALARDAEVILVGMQMTPNLGPRYTEEFHDAFREVSTALDAELVPFLLEGIDPDTMMQRDGIHPTAEVQPILLDNVWEVLAPLLH